MNRRGALARSPSASAQIQEAQQDDTRIAELTREVEQFIPQRNKLVGELGEFVPSALEEEQRRQEAPDRVIAPRGMSNQRRGNPNQGNTCQGNVPPS